MRLAPWTRRAVVLRTGLRVTIVHHPYLPTDRAAAVLRVPVGTAMERRTPGLPALLAVALGTDGAPAELGHHAILARTEGTLAESLGYLAARVRRAAPQGADVGALWARTLAWRDATRWALPVAAMNAAHYAVFPSTSGLALPWPTGGPAALDPPSDGEAAALWRAVNPRWAHLVIATGEDPVVVEARVAEHPIAQWRAVRDAPPWARTHQGQIRIPALHVLDAPIADPSGDPAMLLAFVVPTLGHTAPQAAFGPFLSRLPAPPGTHLAYWPHPRVSLVAAWTYAPVRLALGGAALPAALLDVLHRTVRERMDVAEVRRVGYAVEADLRRVCERPELLAEVVARHLDPQDPPTPPTPPFNPASFAKRLAALLTGVAAPRAVLLRPTGVPVDRVPIAGALRRLALDRDSRYRQSRRRDAPRTPSRPRPDVEPPADPA